MLQWLSGAAHELPLWLAGIDTWRLAMMMVAVPGPLFCLLVLTMPLGGNSDRRPLKDAAAGGPAMIGFVPYARSQWRTLAYFFAVVLVITIPLRSEEHTSELQSLMRTSYAVFCMNNKHTKEHKSCEPISIPLYI